MRLNITLEQALEKASPILREKMKRSVELIKKAEKLSLLYDSENGFFLAFSGGKDSQALYHITELAGVKFKAHFSPTTVDPPQVIRFIRTQYPDVEFGKVTKNIYDMAVEKQILPTRRVRWCCAEYKEMAGAGKVTLIGIRHAESARRAKRNEVEIYNHKFSGDFEQFTEWQEEKIRKKYKNLNQDQFSYDKTQELRCIGGKDSILVSPIIEWTEADVWEFLNKVCEVPHCELYDMGYHRIGCILCPMSNYKQKLKECRDFPYVKAKWIEAIKRIRMRGGIQRRIWWSIRKDNTTDRQNGGGETTEVAWEWQDKRERIYTETAPRKPLGDSTEWTSTRPQNGGGVSVQGQQSMDATRIRGNADSKFRIPKQWISNGGQWVQRNGGLPLTTAIPNGELENQIAENIFDWWISGESYEKWYAEKFLQMKIDFEEE